MLQSLGKLSWVSKMEAVAVVGGGASVGGDEAPQLLVEVDAATLDYSRLNGEWGGVSRNTHRRNESTVWTHTLLEFAVSGGHGSTRSGTFAGKGFSLWVSLCGVCALVLCRAQRVRVCQNGE